MEKDNLLILNELYQNLKEEQDSILEKVNKNLNQIEELDLYIKSILEKQDSDYKVFSPRNVEVIYKEQIETCNAEKYALENENRNYYKQINKVGRYLENLEQVLKEDSLEEVEKEVPEEIVSPISTKNFQIMDIQEKERQRIARDLHDVTLQNLTHIVHKMELAGAFMDQDSLRAKLELAAAAKNLRTAISDIRSIIFDLRPMSFDDLGLKDSLSNFFANLRSESDFNIITDIEDIHCENNMVSITIFRVIQEASMNAVSHSEGNQLEVELKMDEPFYHIRVRDNGKGFKLDDVVVAENRHFGLAVMRERVNLLKGEVNIYSSLEEGTEINIRIPIEKIEVKSKE